MPPRSWIAAAAISLLVLAVYAGSAMWLDRPQTAQMAYFNYQAVAWLGGRLDLVDPPGRHDLTEIGETLHLAFPPLPALVLLPVVAVFGPDRAPVTAVSILAGALSVALAQRLFGRLIETGAARLRAGDAGWLALLFGLGSVHWCAAIDGSVWYLGHIFTVLMLWMALHLAYSNAPSWAAGAALALAVLGRPHVLLAAPAVLGLRLAWLNQPLSAWCGAGARRVLVAVAAPVVLAAGVLALHNVARFGDPLDFGYKRQNVSANVLGDLHEWGQFHPAFVFRNAYVMLLALPTFRADEWWPYPDAHGMSIFVTSPALAALWWARRWTPASAGAAVSVGLIAVPLLLYYNTGWQQFGFRFSLDFLPMALVWLACGRDRPLTPAVKWLIVAALPINLWGVVWWFGRW